MKFLQLFVFALSVLFSQAFLFPGGGGGGGCGCAPSVSLKKIFFKLFFFLQKKLFNFT